MLKKYIVTKETTTSGTGTGVTGSTIRALSDDDGSLRSKRRLFAEEIYTPCVCPWWKHSKQACKQSIKVNGRQVDLQAK
ncbi:hypothetical protein CGGC5_v003622 [Colletotrichum fructicola Nara gc5]|uniref:Uncharacterized protein n=1 Tax=Colletotrichum fructicola (strain Nara gc5) TaxID=1213859 RepID=A0A7J6JI51_COLFN|nr:hypothetical protein CGGC5_v003622 [Colletotrichum fructicola Nara gc5]